MKEELMNFVNEHFETLANNFIEEQEEKWKDFIEEEYNDYVNILKGGIK